MSSFDLVERIAQHKKAITIAREELMVKIDNTDNAVELDAAFANFKRVMEAGRVFIRLGNALQVFNHRFNAEVTLLNLDSAYQCLRIEYMDMLLNPCIPTK